MLTSKWPWLNMFWKHLTCKNLQVLQGRYKISLQIIYTYFLPPWGKPITINVLYQSWSDTSPNSNDTRVGKNLKNKIPVKLWNDIWADWDKHLDVTMGFVCECGSHQLHQSLLETHWFPQSHRVSLQFVELQMQKVKIAYKCLTQGQTFVLCNKKNKQKIQIPTVWPSHKIR